MFWLEREHPELVEPYRKLYGSKTYAPPGYRKWLSARIRPLIAAHGLQRGVEDPATGGVLSSATPDAAAVGASHGVRSFAELDAVAYPHGQQGNAQQASAQQRMPEPDEFVHPAASNVRFVDAGDGRPGRRPGPRHGPGSGQGSGQGPDSDSQPTLY